MLLERLTRLPNTKEPSNRHIESTFCDGKFLLSDKEILMYRAFGRLFKAHKAMDASNDNNQKADITHDETAQK